MLGRATALPLATPAKLGHDPIYLRVIGRVQGVHSVQVHYVHGVTNKQTNQLQYSAPPLSRAGEVMISTVTDQLQLRLDLRHVPVNFSSN